MTAQPTDQPTIETPAYQVAPRKSSRLGQLHALYADAKAKADAAAAELKAITDGIKNEMAKAAPEGSTKIDLLSPDGPPLRLDYRESWRFNSKAFKRQDPETWVRFAKKSHAWYLVPLSADAPEGGE